MRAIAMMVGGLVLMLMQLIWGHVEREDLQKRAFLPSEYLMKTPFYRVTVFFMRPWLWWYDYSVVNGGAMAAAPEDDDTLPATHHRTKREREAKAAGGGPDKYGPGVLLVTYHSVSVLLWRGATVVRTVRPMARARRLTAM